MLHSPKYEALERGKASLASGTMQKAGNMAKAAVNAASNPHDIISGGVRTVEQIGLQTLQEIEHSRLDMKEKTQHFSNTDEEEFNFCPDDSNFSRIRNLVCSYGLI